MLQLLSIQLTLNIEVAGAVGRSFEASDLFTRSRPSTYLPELEFDHYLRLFNCVKGDAL